MSVDATKIQILYRIRKGDNMNKENLNTKVVNKVIAFKLLEVLRDYGMVDMKKYKSVEQKRFLYNEDVVSKGKIFKGDKNGE